MADLVTILGATAASTQLLVQFGKSIAFLFDLQSKMKAAPVEVQRQTVHIDQLIALSELFKETPSLHGPITPYLDTCLARANDILTLIQKYTITDDDGRFDKAHKSFKIAWKDKDILRMFSRLEEEKKSMILAIQQVDSKLIHETSLQIATVVDVLPKMSSQLTSMDTTLQAIPEISTIVRAIPEMSSEVKDILIGVNDLRMAHIQPSEAPKISHRLIQVPNRAVKKFIGRKDILTSIAAGFSKPNEDKCPRIVTISGLGGQGKTQIALEYCRRAKEDKMLSIFWVDAMSQDLVLASFKRISSLIVHPGQEIQDEQVIQFVLERLSTWSHPWILVFDNHDDPSSFYLPEYFPPGEQGRILVTSRHAGVADFEYENAIKLEGLSETEALELLFARSRAKNIQSNIEHGKVVVRRLGFHTLAIAQAGSFLLSRGFSLTRFMDLFETQRESILKHTTQMSEYRRQLSTNAQETTLNVFTTWELSFQLLKQSNVGEERREDLLTLFAFCGSQNVSEDLFRVYSETTPDEGGLDPSNESQNFMRLLLSERGDWDHGKFENVLVEMNQMGLVQASFPDDGGSCHIVLHPLVRDWIRMRISTEQFQANSVIFAHVIRSIFSRYYNIYFHDLPQSVVLTIQSHSNTYMENYKVLEKKLGLKSMTAIYHEFEPSDHCLCQFLTYNMQLQEAELVARRALDFREALGVEHVEYLTSTILLGLVFQKKGNYEESERLYRDAIKRSEHYLGLEHSVTLHGMDRLSALLVSRGRDSEAEVTTRRILQIRERLFGPVHLYTLHNVESLASLLRRQGKYTETKKLLRSILKVQERVLGPEHLATLATFSDLAVTLLHEGQYSEAKEIQQRLVLLYQRILGEEHHDTMGSFRNLTKILLMQGNLDEAEGKCHFAITLHQKILGPEHPYTVSSFDNLGYLRFKQGKYEESEDICRHVLRLREKVLGKEHEETLLSVWNLASVLENLHRLDEAEVYLERNTIGYAKLLGADHPRTLRCLNQLSELKEKLRLAQQGNGESESEEDWETEEDSDGDDDGMISRKFEHLRCMKEGRITRNT